MVSTLASGPRCSGFDSQCMKFIFDVAEGNQWGCFAESGQLLENIDPTQLVLGIT